MSQFEKKIKKLDLFGLLNIINYNFILFPVEGQHKNDEDKAHSSSNKKKGMVNCRYELCRYGLNSLHIC